MIVLTGANSDYTAKIILAQAVQPMKSTKGGIVPEIVHKKRLFNNKKWFCAFCLLKDLVLLFFV